MRVVMAPPKKVPRKSFRAMLAANSRSAENAERKPLRIGLRAAFNQTLAQAGRRSAARKKGLRR